jgi:hypothetical protein
MCLGRTDAVPVPKHIGGRDADLLGVDVMPDRLLVEEADGRVRVYQPRTREDLLDRIRKYEQEHPRPVRRTVVDPEADFIDADEEDY